MTAVLHTWGQSLCQHLHLHCLVPAGAYQQADQTWHPASSTYLFPVKALMRVYRGVMVSTLRQAHREGRLSRVESGEVDACLDALMATPWVVYARGTCHGSTTILGYLARYTHRIAISDTRLQGLEGDAVSFRYKDYAAGGKHKTLRLPGEEFVRRFLLHVLPHGFMRIRHYGFLANACRKKRLAQIRVCLSVHGETENPGGQVAVPVEPQSHPPVLQGRYCPRCHQSVWRVVDTSALEGRRR